jgi:hypothetical protein
MLTEEGFMVKCSFEYISHERNYFIQTPNMIGNARFHRWRDAE